MDGAADDATVVLHHHHNSTNPNTSVIIMQDETTESKKAKDYTTSQSIIQLASQTDQQPASQYTPSVLLIFK